MTGPSPLHDVLQDVLALEAASDPEAGVKALRPLLHTTPAHFEGWITLSRLLFDLDRFEEAVDAGRRAEQADPLAAEFQAVQRAMQAKNIAAATQAAQAMLETAPWHPRAVFTLAHISLADSRPEGAVAILDEGLRIGPANPVLQRMLVGALEQSGAYTRAVETARLCVRLDPGFEAQWGLVGLLLRYGLHNEALAACDQAEALCGRDSRKLARVDLVRGQLLRVVGDSATSIAAFRRSLAHDPGTAEAWWGLADLKTFTFTDADREALEGLVDRPDLDAPRRSQALFALARCVEVQDGPAAAFELYRRANVLQGLGAFDAARFNAGAGRLVRAFDPQALQTRAKPDAVQMRPVFIIGLPRSGSTLIEQILASHSAITGTMEQPTLPAIKRKAHLWCADQLQSDYLSGVGQIPEAELARLRDAYLSEARLFGAPASGAFTDKLPHNFEHVGLIHKILPDAVIIDVRRNPMDCGWSLYKQCFAQGVEFSRRLEDIGAYYNGYLRIMDHWDAVLPGVVHRIQYESLIENPQGVITAMLDHAGLEFEPACLSFHETKRAVRTASSEQVRQPLNTAGVGAWRSVQRELAPLKAALGAATLARFEAWL